MKIKYITEDGIELLRNNANVVFEKVIKEGEKNILDILGDTGYVKETSFEIEQFTLDFGSGTERETLTDGENAQRVYRHMQGLSDSQASDERIWVAYTLLEQIEYMKLRWPCETANDLLNRYFFNYSSNRSLFRNGMARLWWIGRVTYDPKRTDPFELTKYLCKDQDFIETVCGRSIFNNPLVHRAPIGALYDSERDGFTVGREGVREVAKYVNLLSGVYIIDMLSYDEIYEKVKNKIEELKAKK